MASKVSIDGMDINFIITKTHHFQMCLAVAIWILG